MSRPGLRPGEGSESAAVVPGVKSPPPWVCVAVLKAEFTGEETVPPPLRTDGNRLGR